MAIVGPFCGQTILKKLAEHYPQNKARPVTLSNDQLPVGRLFKFFAISLVFFRYAASPTLLL
jgi:hypothetical protein